MKSLLLTTVLAATTTPALAVENYRTWTGPELLQLWATLNVECRGGSGDEATTTRACDERNLVDTALFAHGYCFVGMGSTSRWEKGPGSRWTRRGENAVCHATVGGDRRGARAGFEG
jgi:hypothetical protein